VRRSFLWHGIRHGMGSTRCHLLIECANRRAAERLPMTCSKSLPRSRLRIAKSTSFHRSGFAYGTEGPTFLQRQYFWGTQARYALQWCSPSGSRDSILSYSWSASGVRPRYGQHPCSPKHPWRPCSQKTRTKRKLLVPQLLSALACAIFRRQQRWSAERLGPHDESLSSSARARCQPSISE